MKIDIKGYEGLYQVDTDGNIYSMRKNLKMKLQTEHQGYLKINLWDGELHKTFRVHRLVALHFISNPQNKPQINHIDGNKQNNNIKNLEWATAQENERHSIDILGKTTSYPGRKQKNNKYGMQGVSTEKGRGFRARIVINGKKKNIGTFKTAKEAGEAYQDFVKNNIDKLNPKQK
ncbi:NUMOD4 motif-containing HNH endonuclease [Sulfurimonas sp.]|uniref:NUMOD4 motif-containing HNH endonuclease n=1 Tax=Sulfurimonas sp. TaxID=2022749 RepID=UPI0025EA82DD|nr:NUMOD4 motif-containing HNH endonuclease [Sulfurimonas sp.]